MDLAAVMDELGDALENVTGLAGRVTRWPTAQPPSPPFGIVAWPEGDIDYLGAFQRGMDTWDQELIVVASQAYDRAARDHLAAFVAGSGAGSVKTAIEAHAYTTAASVHVRTARITGITIGAVDYVGAQFTVRIAGRGA